MGKIRIDLLLVEKNFAPSRSKALQLIQEGKVYVNHQLVNKAGLFCNEEDCIEIQENHLFLYVSRGGLKLKKAIDTFHIHLKDKVVLDIGASTGGFTDCCLKQGASHVYALDVGINQLAESLKKDTRVTNYEGINFKSIDLSYFSHKIDYITIDVSFISIQNILMKVNELFSDIIIMGLFKPQFEVGKQNINKNGVVKNKKVHKQALKSFQEFLKQQQFYLNQLTYSPIIGAKEGNIEYLCFISRDYQKQEFAIDQIVDEAFLTLKGVS